MFNFSMLNGVWDGIATVIGNLLARVFDFIMELFNRLFYFLFAAVGQLADMVQALFRAFCGLGTNTVFGSGHPTDDIYIIFQSPTITNILIAMGALALLLLIITTGIAVVKTEFVGLSEKGGNNKSKVVGTALKALANIVVVPLCCIISVLAVNAVLRAVDEITAGGENIALSSQVFVACAHDANKLRTDYDVEKGFTAANFALFLENNVNTFGVDFDKYYSASGANAASSQEEKYAMVVDYLFKNGIAYGDDFIEAWENGHDNIVMWSGNIGDGEDDVNFDDIESMEDDKYYIYTQGAPFGSTKSSISKVGYFSYYHVNVVKIFYNIGDFNIIVALLAIIVIAYNLLVIVLGCVKRFFELTILFVISPTVSAVTPLDGGSALKNWRSSFISSLLSLFGPVIAINLFFVILPLMFEINFLSGTGLNAASGALSSVDGYEALAEILITCAGIIYIKDLSASIGKIFGAGDALSTGESAKKDFASKVRTAQNIGKTLGAATMAPIKAGGSIIKGYTTGIKDKDGNWQVGTKAAFKGMGDSLLGSTNDVFGRAVGTINEAYGSKFNKKALGNKAFNSMVAFGSGFSGGIIGTVNKETGRKLYDMRDDKREENKEFDMDSQTKFTKKISKDTKSMSKSTAQIAQVLGNEDIYDKNGALVKEASGIAGNIRQMSDAVGVVNRHKDGSVVDADTIVARLRAIKSDTGRNNKISQAQLEADLQQLGYSEAEIKAILKSGKLPNKP